MKIQFRCSDCVQVFETAQECQKHENQHKLEKVRSLYFESSDFVGRDPILNVLKRERRNPFWYEEGNGASHCSGCKNWFDNIGITVVDHIGKQFCSTCLFSIARLYFESDKE